MELNFLITQNWVFYSPLFRTLTLYINDLPGSLIFSLPLRYIHVYFPKSVNNIKEKQWLFHFDLPSTVSQPHMQQVWVRRCQWVQKQDDKLMLTTQPLFYDWLQTQHREDGMSDLKKKKTFYFPINTKPFYSKCVSKYLARLPTPATATETHWDTI